MTGSRRETRAIPLLDWTRVLRPCFYSPRERQKPRNAPHLSLTNSFEEAYHAFHYSQTRLLSLRDRETTSAARPKKPRRSTGSRREHVSGAGTDHEAGAGRIEVERQERAVPEIELMRDCRPSSANLRPGSHPSGPSIGRTRSSCRIPTLARCFARPMTGRAAVSESRVRSPRFEPEGMFRTARRGTRMAASGARFTAAGFSIATIRRAA